LGLKGEAQLHGKHLGRGREEFFKTGSVLISWAELVSLFPAPYKHREVKEERHLGEKRGATW